MPSAVALILTKPSNAWRGVPSNKPGLLFIKCMRF
nr:MAG TPA: hypothetical protein [Caudoviricetes sp.]